MRTYKTKKGYFYKELQNGKKKRISREEYQKLKKQKKTGVKKTLKQTGGLKTTSDFATYLLENNTITEITQNLHNQVIEHRADELWNQKCRIRSNLSVVNAQGNSIPCKKCKRYIAGYKLYQCSYCGHRYHNACWEGGEINLKSTKGGVFHKAGNNSKTPVCGACFTFLTAVKALPRWCFIQSGDRVKLLNITKVDDGSAKDELQKLNRYKHNNGIFSDTDTETYTVKFERGKRHTETVTISDKNILELV